MLKEQDNPLISFIVITYNQENYIREAVESALAQDYSPLEIIISDDCSEDRTFQFIEDIVNKYTGSHSVTLNRNNRNMGLGAHVNRIWELASGELLVMQAGDDISVPHRTSSIVDAWRTTLPTPDLICSSVKLIDKNSDQIGERIITEPVSSVLKIKNTIIGRREYAIGGCCSAYTKKLHWTAGPLSEDTIAEDFIYTFRAIIGNGIVGIKDTLVYYRQHDESIVGKARNRRNNKRKNFVGRHSRLLEYKKAMYVYNFTNLYLLWRLNRRIKTYDLAIRMFDAGFLKRIALLIQAIITLKFEFIELIPGAFRYALDKIR